MTTQHYDAIVVGLGGVGSFALRALSKEKRLVNKLTGSRYLGIEQGSLAFLFQHRTKPDIGYIQPGYSSNGYTRIYRRAYFEHANYVPWIDYSINVIREIEKASEWPMMRQCGMLILEPAANTNQDVVSSTKSNVLNNFTAQSKTEQQIPPPLIAASLNSSKLHDIPVEFLSTAQLKEKYPQFHYGTKTNMVGLLEPGGGLLRPERIMKIALQEAFESGKVSVFDKTKVDKIIDYENKGIVELQISGHKSVTKVTTKKLLVSMGSWTGSLIPSWDHFLFPVRQVQGWIDTQPLKEKKVRHQRNIFSADVMPAFVYMSPDWPEGLYGVPCDDKNDVVGHEGDPFADRSNWLKIGIHKQNYLQSRRALSSNDHRHSLPSKQEEAELKRILPLCINTSALYNDELVGTKPCQYTMTPDKHFAIGEVSKNIFCVAGLSGHGFKMTPALGQMMADFAIGKNVSTDWNIDFCSPERFKNTN